jgi:hypothetical protein
MRGERENPIDRQLQLKVGALQKSTINGECRKEETRARAGVLTQNLFVVIMASSCTKIYVIHHALNENNAKIMA